METRELEKLLFEKIECKYVKQSDGGWKLLIPEEERSRLLSRAEDKVSVSWVLMFS